MVRSLAWAKSTIWAWRLSGTRMTTFFCPSGGDLGISHTVLDGAGMAWYNGHMSTATLRARQRYAVDTLAGDLAPGRRAVIEASLARINGRLGVRCASCGRALEAAGSVAAGVGPVCAHKTAR